MKNINSWFRTLFSKIPRIGILIGVIALLAIAGASKVLSTTVAGIFAVLVVFGYIAFSVYQTFTKK